MMTEEKLLKLVQNYKQGRDNALAEVDRLQAEIQLHVNSANQFQGALDAMVHLIDTLNEEEKEKEIKDVKSDS